MPSGRNCRARMPHVVVISVVGPRATRARASRRRSAPTSRSSSATSIGGAAHLWDCIPSKALIATGGELLGARARALDGPRGRGPPRRRRAARAGARRSRTACSTSIESAARVAGRAADPAAPAASTDPHTIVVETTDAGLEEIEADFVLVCHRLAAPRPRLGAGRRRARAHDPRGVPAARDPRARDRDRVGRHRRGVHPPVRRRSARKVTLLVSRQQVLPIKDAEVAAVLEDAFLAPGVTLLKGARAQCDRARRRRRARALRRRPRRRRARTCCSRSGSIPNTEDLGLDVAGVEVDERGYVTVNHNCLSNVAAHLRRGRRVRQAAAVVGGGDAGPQDRRAPHGPAQPPAPSPRLRQGGVGDLHRARDRRRRAGRGRGVLGRPQDPGHQGAVLGQRRRRSSRATRAGS